MKPRFMLDTNICVYLMKRQPPEVASRFEGLFVGEVVLSAITLAELEYGVASSGEAQAQNRTALDALLTLLCAALYLSGISSIPPTDRDEARFMQASKQMIESGELWMHVGVTLYRVFAGFFLGVLPGIAVGLLMAMFRPVRIFFDPLIASLFPIPKIALMPLLLLAFGFGDAPEFGVDRLPVGRIQPRECRPKPR